MENTQGRADNEPPEGLVHRQLDALKATIWRRRPILGEIIDRHGRNVLYHHTRNFVQIDQAPLLDARKHELIDTAKELISERLGEAVGSGVARQLKKLPLVSTTDHHGPIDHPFFVNANIISALPHIEHTDPDMRYLVVFSFASVSANNPSAYPRGILFHGGVNGSGNLIRLPFLPDKEKMGVVYGLRSYTAEDLERANQDLSKRQAAGEVTAEKAQAVQETIQTFFADPDVLSSPNLCSQVTKINFKLWPQLFHPAKDVVSPQSMAQMLDEKVPNLVYLEIETLVKELLIRYHLNNPASPLYKLLFDPAYRQLALKYFNNIQGSFSLEKGWGTYLFWSMNEKLHRVGLKLNNDTLQAEKGSYNLHLTPDDVRAALEQKHIFPSMLLSYLTVALYYGMKCLGGFSQVHDLTMIKEAWRKLLLEVNEHGEAEAVLPVYTKELGGDGFVLAHLETASGNLIPATGIDLLLEESDTTYESYARLAQRVTLMEMMHVMLPEIYCVLYPLTERDAALMNLSPEQIMTATGLAHKLRRLAARQPVLARQSEPIITMTAAQPVAG